MTLKELERAEGRKLTKAERRTLAPQSYECTTRFGIINPYGGIWSPETFGTKDAAWEHLRTFWRGTKMENELDGFTVEHVKITVERTPLA